MTSTLTKYKPASFKELFVISLPLMISALSGNVMLFIDRLILARYSTDAMNSVASSGMVAYIFLFGTISIASIAEVFVGQLNGAKKFDKLAEPVWQMIWFCAATIIIFWPLAFFAGDFLIPKKLLSDGLPYFKIVMFFGPLMPLSSALSGFFAGQGKTKIITYSAIGGNLVNLVLDIILVFGYKDIIPSLGTTGAAIATAASMFIQALILGYVFLNKSNRAKFKTLNYKFNKKVFIDCVKVGAPSSIGHIIEMAAWAVLFHVTTAKSILHVTILTMGQNIFILFAFLTDGMQKGVIAVASNLIGAKKQEMMDTLISSAFKLHLVIVGIIAIPLILAPNFINDIFEIDEAVLTMGNAVAIQTSLTFKYVWFYLLFDGMVWVFAGILTSGGDTKFIMYTNAFCSWVFGVLPIFIAMKLYDIEPSLMWLITALYAIFNLILFVLRYKTGKWKKLDATVS